MAVNEDLLRIELLVENVRDLLASSDPVSRVCAVKHLSTGMELIERHVIAEANAEGASWAAIGQVYGVSRQSAHKRFATNHSVWPADFFDTVFNADEEDEPNPAMMRGADRAAKIVKNHEGVSH